jgi:hypothetical protein
MTDQNTATTGKRFSSFKLDADIAVNDQVVHPAGTKIQVRRPGAGELRGVDISATISRCDYTQIEKIAPRITDPADFVQLGGEIVDFLLPKAVKQAAFQPE